MAFRGFQVSREKWLEKLHALEGGNDIYMRFLFAHGRILAKPSKIQVDDKMLHLAQLQSGLFDSPPSELWTSLPEEPTALYQERTNSTGGICLAITYRREIDQFLKALHELHLSNQENFLDREDSASPSPSGA
jgi:hypothetical protein